MHQESKKFLVYRSSAGSGKTYTLVKEYLKLILDKKSDNYYKKVLAITFTNAAAAEMKNRVLQQLEIISGSKEGNLQMSRDIQSDLGMESEELKNKAKKILRNLLHNYSEFQISTIDSFIHGIIRTFALDLRLDPEFEIELDSMKVLSLAVEALVEEVGSNQKVSDFLLDYLNHNIEEGKSWNLNEDLTQFSRFILNEKSHEKLSKIEYLELNDFKEIHKKLKAKNKEIVDQINQWGQEGLKFIESLGLLPEHFSRKVVTKQFEKFIDYDPSFHKKILPSDTLQKMIKGESNFYTAKEDSDIKSLIDSHYAEICGRMNVVFSFLESQEMAEFFTREFVIKSFYNNALLLEINQKVEEWKQENSISLISDFNELIHRVIQDNPAPFIYERIGERFNHILIDEFQDTSTKQWQNFIPLIENSLAKNQFNLLVGDAKQAIYRWRNGNVLQFVNLPKIHEASTPELASVEYLLEEHYESIPLDYNYRSSQQVVQFNNGLFNFLKNHEAIEPIYRDPSQKATQKEDGLVSLKVSIGSNKEDRNPQTIDSIVKAIHDSKEDGFQNEDICILVRTHKQAALIAQSLIEKNFSILSNEGLALNKDRRIRLLISMMSYISEPQKNGFRVNLLKNLVNSNPSLDLGTVLKKYSTFEKDENNRSKRILNLESFLKDQIPNFSLGEALSLSLYSLGEYLMKLLKFDQNMDQYLESIFSILYDFSEKKKKSLPDFLDHWNEKRDSIFLSADSVDNAIRIMTVHKSKGLQFPMVIYPLFPSSVGKNNKYIWIDNQNVLMGLPTAAASFKSLSKEKKYIEELEKERSAELLDEINTLYVGCTRAETRMYLIIEAEKIPLSGDSINQKIIDFVQKNDEQIDLENEELQLGGRSPYQSKKVKDEIQLIRSFHTHSVSDQVELSPKKSEQESLEFTERKIGIVLHEILAESSSIEEANSVCLKRFDQGHFNSEVCIDLQKRLKSFFAWTEINRWFDEELMIKNERELMDEQGQLLIPDRVVYFDDHIDVIDFKTGEESSKHQKQILQYKEQIQKIENMPVNAFLVYLKNKKIVELN